MELSKTFINVHGRLCQFRVTSVDDSKVITNCCILNCIKTGTGKNGLHLEFAFNSKYINKHQRW